MYDRDGSGSITTEEMKAMFVMMCQEPEHLDLEPMELKLVIKSIERMAEEMFHELDADGDGFVTQVSGLQRDNRIFFVINILKEEFIEGCLQNEDLIKHLSSN